MRRGVVLGLLLGCQRREPYIPPDDTGTTPVAEPADEPVVCADPGARSAQGPLRRRDLSAMVAEYVDDSGSVSPAAGSGLAVADLNGDGLLDILLPQYGTDQILIQAEDGSFTDQTSALWPENPDARTMALNTVDIDGDGDEDVFACRELASNSLYLNDGAGVLSDVSAAWGVEGQERGCFNAAFGDIDGDGDLDLALGNNDPCLSSRDGSGEDCSAIKALPSAEVLWENTGAGFVDITDRLSQDDMRASMMSVVTFLDLNADGDLDLLVVNDDRMEVAFSRGHVAYLGDGAGGFEDISASSGLGISMEGMGTGVGDLNGDGQPDLLITGFRDVALMLSAGALWYDADASLGMVPTEESRWFAWGAELVDLDNDTDLDAPVVFGWLPPSAEDENPLAQADALYINDGDDFSEQAAGWGWDDPGYARGVAAVDINGDGWLDLLKRELGGPLLFDEARCGEAAWLTVRLAQEGANTDAVGAAIDITIGGETQRRWVLRGGTSYAVSVPPRVHFGLGEAAQVDALTVTWPDGTVQDFGPQAARQHLTLSR